MAKCTHFLVLYFAIRPLRGMQTPFHVIFTSGHRVSSADLRRCWTTSTCHNALRVLHVGILQTILRRTERGQPENWAVFLKLKNQPSVSTSFWSFSSVSDCSIKLSTSQYTTHFAASCMRRLLTAVVAHRRARNQSITVHWTHATIQNLFESADDRWRMVSTTEAMQ